MRPRVGWGRPLGWPAVSVSSPPHLPDSRSRGTFHRGAKSEIERGSLVLLRLHPYLTAVAIDNPLADRQANARAGNVPAVQPLEHAENVLMILRSDSDP